MLLKENTNADAGLAFQKAFLERFEAGELRRWTPRKRTKHFSILPSPSFLYNGVKSEIQTMNVILLQTIPKQDTSGLNQNCHTIGLTSW